MDGMPKPGTREKGEFVDRLTRLIHGALRDVERAHGDVERYASSVAKRVATQLWALASPDQHADTAAWVRHIRGQLGISQAELGRRLGLSQVTVARWETGVHEPSAEHQEALRGLLTGASAPPADR
ncbi:MAG: helix-turn-helix transcriptional regulator [Candidatus Eremiobacterota bacterium]